ncbi:MAG: tripartite tricarboxylate transporter TctB family protein [Rhodospirillales bacterium]|nr:tripartite tricarboxylate transporter TctB family protein [Rhodospirillales bacterium]
MTDRITGTLLLLLAIAYSVAGAGFESDFISDPLGPNAFPVMLGSALGLFSLYLLFRPDPEPEWPSLKSWKRQGAALAALIIYGIVLEFIGFIISSVVLVGFLSQMLGGNRRYMIGTGIGASIVLYFLFNNVLGLPLPAGEIFGG